MKIKSEWELLENLKQKISKKNLIANKNLLVSIGDDAAVFKTHPKKNSLITTDLSIEGTHFLLDKSSPQDIGFKAMVANISDIAAMGGQPCYAFISLGIPANLKQKFVLSLYDGMIKAANQSKTMIAGGDLTKTSKLTIGITLYGESASPILRQKAKAKNYIYVTGTLGDSKAGLEILTEKIKGSSLKSLINKHQKPPGRFPLVEKILQQYKPTSMIDISDGLLADLKHLALQSNLGFLLYQSNLPFSQNLKKYCQVNKKNILDYLLYSGEEYELLFTSDTKIEKNKINNIKVTLIGKIISQDYYLQEGKKIKKIKLKGFDHFKAN